MTGINVKDLGQAVFSVLCHMTVNFSTCEDEVGELLSSRPV